MQYFIGCSGFYNKDWKEVFYPKGLAQSKWFEYYCTQFNTLELNTTFYRFPTVDMLQKWYDKSPADFRFSVKAPRLITHYKQFNETKDLLNDFYASIKEGLKEKLATVLFQLPGKIVYDEQLLERMFSQLNSAFINVIELRNTSWFNEDVFNKFKQYNIVFCGVSLKGLPGDIINTSQNLYYRFHGMPKLYYSQYSADEMEQFANELQQQTAIQAAYIYFNNTATMAAINNARELKNYLK